VVWPDAGIVFATTRAIAVELPEPVSRADIVFEGVEQAGRSFEGRVFINNPAADHRTERVPRNGYAGAFHVYGYGAAPRHAAGSADAAPSTGPVAPITKYVVATEIVRSALERARELTVTVVAVPGVPGPHFTGVSIAFNRLG
jgi:hypothetical protein